MPAALPYTPLLIAAGICSDHLQQHLHSQPAEPRKPIALTNPLRPTATLATNILHMRPAQLQMQQWHSEA
jgi:hypothetical protein